ncbi:MAG: caspase family protein [Saprospiraceae bacterium]
MVPLFLLLVFNYRYAYLGAQTKRALLIGVGKYPAEGGWASLSSANDLQLIKNVLIDKGYKSEDIMALSDENATKSGIKECIEKRLLGAVRPGDIVYLHYSGHGQQKQDFDGDEVDGYDECIVPYDSPKNFKRGSTKAKNSLPMMSLDFGQNR